MGITETKRDEWTCNECSKVAIVPSGAEPENWTRSNDAVWCWECSADRAQGKRILEGVRSNLKAMDSALDDVAHNDPLEDRLREHLDEATALVESMLEAYR